MEVINKEPDIRLKENGDQSEEKQPTNNTEIEQSDGKGKHESGGNSENEFNCDNDKEKGRIVKQRQCDPCLFDDVKEIANSFCVVCVEYLCKGCARDHRRSKATRNHKVLLETEMPKDPKMFNVMKSLASCPDHPDMEVSYKCKEHKKYICTKCLVVGHRKCDDVLEISNQTTDELTGIDSDTRTLMIEKLRSVKEMTILVRNAKEDNIKQLQTDSSCILQERSIYIKSLQDHLLKLDKKSKNETKTIVKKNLNDLKADVDNCKIIECEETELSCLLDVALNYGNTAEVHIICEKVEKDIECCKVETTKQEMKPELKLKFNRNEGFKNITSIGSVSVVNSKNDGDFQVKSTSIEAEIELSSDMAREKRDNARGKPLMQSSVSKRRTMYDIQNTTSDVAQKCSVTSILILSDGRIVLTEYSNKRIKVLTLDFTVQIDKKLDEKPIDMCQFSRSDFAVILDGVKCIKKYLIGTHSMTYVREFYCKLFPLSIGRIHDKEDHVVIFFSNEEKTMPKSSINSYIEIQIRRMSDGKVLKIFSDLKHASMQHIILENPSRIRKIPREKNAFLISDDMTLHCVETNQGDLSILREKWYLKSFKGNMITEITDIAVDKEGNIYVCGKGTKNIHQISGINFMNNRVLCTVTGTPLSLCVDNDNRQLIVGCENDDFIYVIKLE